MLLDQTDALAERITNYQQLKAQARHAQAFETRAAQLHKVASGLANAVEAMKALKAVGVPIAFKMAAKDQTRARTAQLQQGFAKDPAFVDDPGFDLRFDYSQPLAGVADTVRAATFEAWQKHVAARRERVSADILKALSAVPQYRSIVATVQRCQTQIDQLVSVLPDNILAADKQLSELSDEQREAWQKLTGGELPNEVVLFLRASMGEGAELRLLTAEVLDWLKSRGLDSAFRIKPRQAA